jgi:hypothetical protein
MEEEIDKMANVGRKRSLGAAVAIAWRGVRAATTAAVVLLCSVPMAGAQSRCDASKLNAVGKRAFCLGRQDARASRRGEAVDPTAQQKCLDSFAAQCARAEGIGDCTNAVKSCAELTADLGCAAQHTFLIDVQTGSPIVEAAIPRSAAICADTELHFVIGRDNAVSVATCDRSRAGVECVATELSELTIRSRAAVVGADRITLGAGDPAAGPVRPVEGPDGLRWLCREDDEGMQCICIPWAQD